MEPVKPSGCSWDNNFGEYRDKLDRSLGKLRRDLLLLQEQDQLLLRQLLRIHHTIGTLSGKHGRRQSYGGGGTRKISLENLAIPGQGQPRRLSASKIIPVRRQSEPFVMQDTCSSYEDEMSDTLEDIVEVAHHLERNNNRRDSLDSFEESLESLDMNLEEDMLRLLPPLPLAFSRKRSVGPLDGAILTLPSYKPYDMELDSPSDLANLNKYEISYGELLKRSVKIWKEVQTDQEATGRVDDKKMTTLKLFL
ncbi:unnamed protein product [Owenia fusiformis]|uniref:Uncharacterized protein n=1 Tax=Owenia fusiformis TaxID=6347 RepID=A0A8J1TDV1_OWEFU|nr:unnamed protein product [Owenia fusiformis]